MTLSGGDTAATIAAAAAADQRRQRAMVYGTDGGIAPSGLVVMADDKGCSRSSGRADHTARLVLKANPQIEELLSRSFAKLDLTTLQTLNGLASRSVAEAAMDVAIDC